MQKRTTFTRICTSLLLGSAVALCGCVASYQVEIRTEPDGANIEVVRKGSRSDPAVRLPRPTPVSYTFDFEGQGDSPITVRASKERYVTTEQSLSREFTKNLPLDTGLRVLMIPLKPAPFDDTDKDEVVIDPVEGLTIRRRRVRAFQEDIERQGVSVTKIHQFGDGTSIGGLTISSDSKRIAAGVIERVRDDKGTLIQFSNVRTLSTDGAGGVTQTTMGHWLDIDPSFSPNDARLYFSTNRFRTNGLDLVRIDSLTPGGGIEVIYRQNEGWSRFPTESKGGLISFSYLPQYALKSGVSHVWTMAGANAYPVQLREGKQPRVSPSGDRIAYIGPDNKLWVISTKAQGPTQFTTNPMTVEGEPTWSPDGNYLVYVSNEGKDSTGTPNNDIWIMRADATKRIQLTTNGSDDTTPIVDPQTKWIYFVSNRGFKWGIWRMPWPSGLEDRGEEKSDKP